MSTSSLVDTSNLPFELASLARARNYQQWVYRTVEPLLGRRILELGAGIGNMSQWLPLRDKLIYSETDPSMLKVLEQLARRAHGDSDRVEALHLDLDTGFDPAAWAAKNIDTIVSFNVMEHVKDHDAAFAKLCGILKSSQAKGPKRLITFVPAHQWAYSTFDKAFGHYRRYSLRGLKRQLQGIAPEAKVSGRYFNAFGLAGWYVNGVILKRPEIGEGSIKAFEAICPWLAPIDDWVHEKLALPFGQSVLVIAEWP